MEAEKRRIADASIIRRAVGEDLDELVQQIWDVATEARWIGTQVPFDRDVRRFRLDALLTGASSSLLVADTSTAGGPGVVGHISVAIAPYGVADIWHADYCRVARSGHWEEAARRGHRMVNRSRGPQDGPGGVASQYLRSRIVSTSWVRRRGA
jgi:hypothetical protein